MKQILLLLVLSSITACASGQKSKPPALENRTFLISKEVPGLYYQWKECKKTGLFGNCRQELIESEQYDFRDDVTRNKFRDMGITCTSERKIKP